VQHVDTAPPPPRGIGHRRERRVFGHVRLERDAIPGAAAGLPRHCDRFLGGGEIVVDGEHLGPFLNEPKHGRATVAHALARRLACPHHDGDFVLKTHWEPSTLTCRPTPYGKSADDTSTSRGDSFLRVACVKITGVPEGKASIREILLICRDRWGMRLFG